MWQRTHHTQQYNSNMLSYIHDKLHVCNTASSHKASVQICQKYCRKACPGGEELAELCAQETACILKDAFAARRRTARTLHRARAERADRANPPRLIWGAVGGARARRE